MKLLVPIALTLLAGCNQPTPEATGPVTRIEIGKGAVAVAASPHASSPATASPCEQVTFEDVPLTHCLADPAKHDALDALFAGFPAGTVSGAPKIRACQIIAELEPETRGAYAGGVGYFAPDGSIDSCIVLRTGIVKDGVLHVQAGAGIVADSDPAYELRECEAKAGALIAAAREAVRVAGEAGFGQ